jgi:hypothetical protein
VHSLNHGVKKQAKGPAHTQQMSYTCRLTVIATFVYPKSRETAVRIGFTSIHTYGEILEESAKLHGMKGSIRFGS